MEKFRQIKFKGALICALFCLVWVGGCQSNPDKQGTAGIENDPQIETSPSLPDSLQPVWEELLSQFPDTTFDTLHVRMFFEELSESAFAFEGRSLDPGLVQALSSETEAEFREDDFAILRLSRPDYQFLILRTLGPIFPNNLVGQVWVNGRQKAEILLGSELEDGAEFSQTQSWIMPEKERLRILQYTTSAYSDLVSDTSVIYRNEFREFEVKAGKIKELPVPEREPLIDHFQVGPAVVGSVVIDSSR